MNFLKRSKRIIKYFIPYGAWLLLDELRDTIQAVKVKKGGHWFIPSKNHEECIIVANGPSVAENRQDIIEYAANRDVVTVNYAIITDLFNELNPFMHVLADPVFFGDNSVESTEEELLEQLYTKLNSLDQPLVLAVPHQYYRHVNRLVNNKNITVVSFSNKRIHSNFAWTDYQLRNGLKTFGLTTVPIVALYLALMIGYSHISLVGLDFSYKYQIDEQCQIIGDHTHYYGGYPVLISNDYFHDYYLIPFSEACKELLAAKHYANKKKISISNLSLKSMIDIFPKSTFGGKIFPFKGNT